MAGGAVFEWEDFALDTWYAHNLFPKQPLLRGAFSGVRGCECPWKYGGLPRPGLLSLVFCLSLAHRFPKFQVPLILSWALSIHKSQGQTIERVKVDLGQIFEKGQGETYLKE